MESTLSAGLMHLAQLIHLRELASSMGHAGLLLGGIFAGVFLLEIRSGGDASRYRSRHFLNDVLYVLFYQGGFYGLFVGAAITNAMGPRLSFFKIEVLATLPAPLHWLLYWVILDFIDYWWHRLKHHSKFLWAFHSIHHSQERMTFVTSWRNHPVEQVISNIIMFVPLLVLGVPTHIWFPLVTLQYAFEAVQHSQLNWRYGPCYPVFVSPVFHNFHHSTDPRHHNRNFAKLLSIWDFLFGTAVRDEPRPVATGIAGLPVPESIPQQLLAPFRLLLRGYPRARGSGMEPPVTAPLDASPGGHSL